MKRKAHFQRTFAAQTSFEKCGRKSKRERFLDQMKEVVPYARLLSPVEPHYPKADPQKPAIKYLPQGIASEQSLRFSRICENRNSVVSELDYFSVPYDWHCDCSYRGVRQERRGSDARKMISKNTPARKCKRKETNSAAHPVSNTLPLIGARMKTSSSHRGGLEQLKRAISC
jgi:hypothetical protein